MEHQAETRILIVGDDILLQSVYSSVLESQGYIVHQCSYTSLESGLDPVPDLIILHYTIDVHGAAVEFLAKVHRVYGDASRPLLLIVAPKHWSDLSLIALVDDYRVSPIAPDYFRKTVEDLLQKKHPSQNG